MIDVYFFYFRYQKTAGAMSAVGEKTSSLFGGIGAKFGQLKETPTFKSFEERVGGVYSAARVSCCLMMLLILVLSF